MDFRDKVILVTGASRGIGAALAEAFAREGGTVAVNYRQDTAAADATVARCEAAGGSAWAVQADVTDHAAVDAMVAGVLAETGRLDVVVNNAFAPYRFDPDTRARFAELPWSAFQAQIDGAVRSCHHVCQAVLPHLRERATGSIVNLLTDLTEQPVVPYADYATAKAALTGFTRQLAADLGPHGVRVNGVAPGLVWPTDASRATRASVREAIAAQTPLRRLASPQDVAGPVLFLASDWARFVTGQVVVVDGGLVMR